MGTPAAFYPLRDFSLRDTGGSSHEYERQRIEALTLLQNGGARCIVTTIDAALQYAPAARKAARAHPWRSRAGSRSPWRRP